MSVPTDKEKDFVLRLYYNRDIKGIEPQVEECPKCIDEIETILQDEGYIQPYKGCLVINMKGKAFLDKGGYTTLRNKELMKYGISFVSGAFTVILTWLLTQCSK